MNYGSGFFFEFSLVKLSLVGQLRTISFNFDAKKSVVALITDFFLFLEA